MFKFVLPPSIDNQKIDELIPPSAPSPPADSTPPPPPKPKRYVAEIVSLADLSDYVK